MSTFNHLSVRIICAVFFLLLVSIFLLYQLVSKAFEDFAAGQSRRELTEIGQQVYAVAEQYYDSVQRSRNRYESSALVSKAVQDQVLKEILRIMQDRGVHGAVFEDKTELLIESPELAGVLKKAKGLGSGTFMRLTVDPHSSYYLLNQHFQPWRWEIILARDASASAAMVQHIRTIYFIAGSILLGNVLLIFLFVRNSISEPMRSIIGAIERGQKPSYHGIHEFEVFSKALAKLFEEKDRLVHQLLQDQIMENLRVTTRGVVHNFNNILVGVLGYASLAKLKLQGIQQRLSITDKGFDDVVKYIDSIEQAAERAGMLAHKLSSIAQTRTIGAGQFILSDINNILLDLQPIIRTIFTRDTELRFELAEKLPLILADPSQLEQAILNLCINSRDAMTQGGTLTIVSRSVYFDAPEEIHALQNKGTYVAIDIQDTGEGMDEATFARLFEPFFTTKPMNQGTGLGLTMVDMIMKAHYGFVVCKSELHVGTTFTLYLPAERS
jgi:signal transduction histidine kinase